MPTWLEELAEKQRVGRIARLNDPHPIGMGPNGELNVVTGPLTYEPYTVILPPDPPSMDDPEDISDLDDYDYLLTHDANPYHEPAGTPEGGRFAPGPGVEQIPVEQMGTETKPGLDWEYDREYKVYSQPHFPKAFSSREDFQQKYDAAPLVHMTVEQLRGMGNSMAASGLHQGEQWAHDTFGHRRDVNRIIDQIKKGESKPPIVLAYDKGGQTRHWLMGGQTRIATALALGKIMPVKMIPVKR